MILNGQNLLISAHPGFTTIQKTGKSLKVIYLVYENMKVIESSIEVYGNMQVIKRPYYSMIPCKSYTVPEYGHSMGKHAQIFSDYDNVFL